VAKGGEKPGKVRIPVGKRCLLRRETCAFSGNQEKRSGMKPAKEKGGGFAKKRIEKNHKQRRLAEKKSRPVRKEDRGCF